jgi:hypothetical protein
VKSGESSGVRAGAMVSVAVVLMTLLLSVLQLVFGKPIMTLGTLDLSVAYAFAVYLPLFLICIAVLVRFRR